uniref:Major facilitator superfamily domain-containing protein 10 n=2 Tax=Canis lupus TaxID=9612 RepID=A0A8C0LZC6_CANLF
MIFRVLVRCVRAQGTRGGRGTHALGSRASFPRLAVTSGSAGSQEPRQPGPGCRRRRRRRRRKSLLQSGEDTGGGRRAPREQHPAAPGAPAGRGSGRRPHFRGGAWSAGAPPPGPAGHSASVSVRVSVSVCPPRARDRGGIPAAVMGWGAGGSCTPRPPIHQQTPQDTRVITVVFLGLLLDLLAFTLLLPLLPGLLESHSRAHDPLYGSWQRGVDWFAAAIRMPAEKRYNSVLFGGLIGSVFSFLQFLLAPLTGAVSDCLGRRPTMLLSLTGLVVSYAVWATSRSFAAFLASRVIGGISKGNVSLSTAIIADLSSPSARSRGMAVIGVAFSLGFTLGPMLGASLPSETVPWLALLFAVSNLLFMFCFLPETLLPEKRAPSITPGFRAAADLLSPLALLRFSAVTHSQDTPAGDRLWSLRRLGLVYFLYLFLFSGLEYTLSFLAHQRFQFSSLQQGKMFFSIGLSMAAVQGAYARRISPGGEITAVKRAILLLVPAFLLIGWGLTLPVLGLGLLLYSFAAAVVVPCLSSVVADYGSAGQKGTIMGTLRSLGALARAVGPMVAASVYWLAGARVCFTVCSGLFLLPFLLLRKLRPPAHTLKAE